MNTELATLGLIIITVVLGLIAWTSAPTLAVIAFALAGIATLALGATAVLRMIR